MEYVIQNCRDAIYRVYITLSFLRSGHNGKVLTKNQFFAKKLYCLLTIFCTFKKEEKKYE